MNLNIENIPRISLEGWGYPESPSINPGVSLSLPDSNSDDKDDIVMYGVLENT